MVSIFSLFTFSLSSIFWGFLIAAVLVVVFWYLLSLWHKDQMKTAASGCMTVLLFFFVLFHSVLFMVAWNLTNVVDEVEQTATKTVQATMETVGDVSHTMTEGDAQMVINRMCEEFPVIEPYVNRVFNSGQFVGQDVRMVPQTIGNTLRSFLHDYMLRRVLWALGAIFVAAILVIIIGGRMNPGGESSYLSRSIDRSGGRSGRRERHPISRDVRRVRR